MTVLVTGAGGQVGRELIRRGRGSSFIGLDRTALDITDQSAVDAAIAHSGARLVINAAAYTAVDRAEAEPESALAVNRDGAAVLAAACDRAGIPLLHLSTDYVFDGTGPTAYSISAPAVPTGIYGRSKWEGEEAIRNKLRQHLILRVSWVFGASGANFVRTMLRLGRERERLRVVGDQRGAPTHAGAIADALIGLAQRHLDGESLPWGTWHYTGTPSTTWHGFATAIVERAFVLGLMERAPAVDAIATADYPTPARRPANSELELTESLATLGLASKPWIDGLDEVLREWKQAHE